MKGYAARAHHFFPHEPMTAVLIFYEFEAGA